MTDSGGLQEEAVSLGKRVMILREYTERVETVWEGLGILTGTDTQIIVNVVEEWYSATNTPSQKFIYGDGNVAQKIVDVFLEYLP
jgi:UDP-N-acetylglucosamine 2-epimerase